MVKEHTLFIAGQRRPGRKAVEIQNPYNGEAVGFVHLAGEDEIEMAIEGAEDGFKEMKRLPVYRRVQALNQIADGLEERAEEFAGMISGEAGKPITDARTEVSRGVLNFRTAAAEAGRLFGEVIPLDLAAGSDSRFGIVRRFPIGPILGITPFNFPLNLVGHKLAPALAAGNSIVIKPAPQAPITALMLGELIAGTDLPLGAVSVVPCDNALAEKMVCDDRFKMLSFTGSAPVGWKLKALSGKKKVALELGGNAGVIIHDDTDLEYAARRCAVGGFSYSGQTCISVQRIYVQEGALD
ncbi:MAG TPA: aldehyde dehydrogenase family protein, partial [Nitrospiria bacterium]|nr:aldehyde dehydrogenase family protein [Nitrospiria bacterium]